MYVHVHIVRIFEYLANVCIWKYDLQKYLQYYCHYTILVYTISISQTFSHVNNIAYAIYCRISSHIADSTT